MLSARACGTTQDSREMAREAKRSLLMFISREENRGDFRGRSTMGNRHWTKLASGRTNGRCSLTNGSALDARGLRQQAASVHEDFGLSLIHISEPTRLLSISYAVFC